MQMIQDVIAVKGKNDTGLTVYAKGLTKNPEIAVHE